MFPTAQIVSASYYPVNVLFTQVPALYSDFFFRAFSMGYIIIIIRSIDLW